MSAGLQQQLASSLSEVGYGGKVGPLPPAVAQSERLGRFLQWLVHVLQPANCLSAAELERFEVLKSSGNILEGQELQRALSSLGPSERQQTDAVRREVAGLQKAIPPLKAQLQSLNTIQKQLNDHHATLLHRRDDLAQQKAKSEHSYQRARERAEEDGAKIDQALEELKSAVQELSSFHRGEGAQATPSFLSMVPQEPYHKAEDHFLSELTAYTKKQFFQGIAVLASSPDTTQCGVLDLGDEQNVLLRGVSQEDYQRHRQELLRLQSIYPLTEVQRINAVVAEQHALGACRRAEEEMGAEAQQREGELDHSTLRHQIQVKQAEVAELRSQLHHLGQTRLPGLLQDMATLEVTKVLHGDYDLKIARQDYYTSKQDKVITHLQSQRARQELLSMLYEVELRRHRETHRLLSATDSQLEQWRREGEGRIQAMQNSAVLPVKSVRQTIDSRDMFAQRLCTLLGVHPTSTAPLITHASLVAAVEQLSHELTTAEALLAAHLAEQEQLTKETESLTAQFERQVFGRSGGCTDKPQLTPKQYEEECSKLKSVLGTLEQNIKTLLKDYDSKKKILQANPLMETERKLFVYFFTDPSKLSQVVAELARRVDAIATAQNTQQ